MKIERPESKQPMPQDAKRVFKGVVFDVYQWEVQGYDGSTKTFEKLKRADTVVIIPVTKDGKIVLSRQEQPGKEPYIDFLGGRADEGEDVFEAAKRELLEETGFQATDWELLDAVQPTSKIEYAVYIFVARGCEKVADPSLDGAEKVELLFTNFDEFVEKVLDDKFDTPEFRVRVLEAKIDPKKMSDLKKQLLG